MFIMRMIKIIAVWLLLEFVGFVLISSVVALVWPDCTYADVVGAPGWVIIYFLFGGIIWGVILREMWESDEI